MRKRLLSVLLVCSMILSLFPAMGATALAAGAEDDFTADNGVITDYTGDGGDVVIPDTIDGQSVTGIEAFAFGYGYCEVEITTVTIPAGVNSIEDYAFSGQELTDVTFLGRCASIGFDAFDSMDGFTVHCRPDDISYYEYEIGFDTVVGDAADAGAHTHTWDSGIVTTDPTCITAGVKTFTCTGCSATKTEAVPMTDHSYGEDGVCTTEGCTAAQSALSGKLTGSGSPENPYVISSADELALLSTAVKAGETCEGQYFELTADITVTGKWTAIGYSSSQPFCGSFDGNGHSVTIEAGSGFSNYGLFGYVKDATIENLIVKGSISGSNNVGGVVGQAVHATLRNLGNEASVTGSSGYVGGVVGYAAYDMRSGSDPCTIESCYNRGSVTCTSTSAKTVGGIAGGCGSMSSGTTAFVSCYNTGAVTGYYAGGILGSNDSGRKVSFSSCYDAGPLMVSGRSFLGSMAGFCNNLGSDPKLANCYYVTEKNKYTYSTTTSAANDQALGNGGEAGIPVTSDAMKSADTLAGLGSSYKADSGINSGYPVLFWEKTCEHPAADRASVAAVAPTCTEKGYTEGTQCKLCGVYLSGHSEIAPLGHTHGDEAGTVTEPTCTEKGFTTYTCTRCSISYQDDFVDATGHDFDSDGSCTHAGCTVTDSFYQFFSGVKPSLAAYHNDTVWTYDEAGKQLKASGNKTGEFTLTAKKGGELSLTVKSYYATLTVKNGSATLKEVKGSYSAAESSFTLRVESGDVLTLQYSSYSSNYYCYLTAISYTPDCEHLNREQSARKAPTCTETGYEAGEHCLDCGKYFGTPIAPTGHQVDEAGTCAVCGKTDLFSLFFRDVSDGLAAINDTAKGWTRTASYISSRSGATSGGFTLYAKKDGTLTLSGKAYYYSSVSISVNGGTAVKYPGSTGYSEKGVSYVQELHAGDTVRIDYAVDSTYSSSQAYVRFTSVSFEAPAAAEYTITASAGANGSITPEGAVKVAEGGSQSFTIRADDGYMLDTLTVDGKTIELPGTSYTFANVMADHTISAAFKPAPVEDLFQKFFAGRTGMTAQNSTDEPWGANAAGSALLASGKDEALFTLTAAKDGYLTVRAELSMPLVNVALRSGNAQRVLSASAPNTATAADLPVKTGDTVTVTYSCSYPYADETYSARITAISISETCPHTVHPYTEETPAGCETNGCKAHYKCLTCGKCFADAACTEELSDVVIPAAHSYGEPVFTSGPAKVVTCAACGRTTVLSGSNEGDTSHTVAIAGANASWTAEGKTAASYSVGSGKDFYFIAADSGYLIRSVSGAIAVAGYEGLYKVTAVAADVSVTVNTAEIPESEYNFALRDAADGSGKVAYIIGYTGKGGDITLPTEYNDGTATYSVVGVAEGAFCGNGNYFYDGHTPLDVAETITSITVPKGIKYIEALAFDYVGRYQTKTWKLTRVTFEDPDTVFVPDILNDGTERNIQLGGNPNLTAVTLPANLAKIPGSLFYQDTSLNNVVIPQGVTVIGARAFEDCTGLTSLTMQSAVPPAVEVYSSGLSKTYPFKGCTVTVTVPKGSLAAYEAAWAEMLSADPALAGSVTLQEQGGSVSFTQFTEDDIEYRVVSMDAMTAEVKYVGRNGSGKLTIPESVSTTKAGQTFVFQVVGIGEKAMDFNGCQSGPYSSSSYSFSEVVFPSTLQYIEKWGCAGLAKVKTLDFSDTGLTRIGSFAFNNCQSVETISLPDTLKDLGVSGELDRTDDTMGGGELDLPDNIAAGSGTNADAGANTPEKAPEQGTENVFRGCQSLKQFIVSENNPYFSVRDGVLFSKDGSKLIRYPVGKPDTAYAIPEGTKTIAEAAFMQIAGNQASGALQTVTFPRSLRTIEDGAFRQSSLTRVELPANVTFGSYIFDCCRNLAAVTVEEGVTEIPEKAFWGCEKLTSVTLAGSVRTIGTSAFERAGLTGLDLKNVETIGDYAFYGAKLTSVTVPASVTTGTGAFMNCAQLVSARVEGKKLDRYMFWYCTGLETLDAPNITAIDEYALGYCVKLDTLPLAKVAAIGDGAFRNCHALSNVTLPAALQTMGKYVFADCGGLTEVTFADGMGVVSLPEGTFYECVNLETVNLGDSISQTEGLSLYMAGWYNGLSVEVYCSQPEDFFFRNEFDTCFIDLGSQQLDNENADALSYIWTGTTVNSEGEKVYHFKARGGSGCGGGCGGGGGTQDELVEYTMTASVTANFHFAAKDNGLTSEAIRVANAPRFAALQSALPTVLEVYVQDSKTGKRTELASYTLPELESMADRTTAGYQYVGMKGWAVMAATEYVTIDQLLNGETFESGDTLIVSASDASYTVTWDELQQNTYFFPNSSSCSNSKVESGKQWVPAMIALTWNTGKVETDPDSEALRQVAATAYKSTNLRFAHGLSWASYEKLEDCDSMAADDVCSAMRMLQRVQSITIVKDASRKEEVVTVTASVSSGRASVAADDMSSALEALADNGLLIIDAASSSAASLSLSLSGADAAALAGKNAQLQLNTAIGSLLLDAASFSGLSRTANGGNVVLSIQKLLRSSLNSALQAELDEHAAIYSVTAVCGSRSVTSLSGQMELRLPYTLQRDEQGGSVRVSMLGSSTLTKLAASYAEGIAVFGTRTLASFAVDVPSLKSSVTVTLMPAVSSGAAFASLSAIDAEEALKNLNRGGELILIAETARTATSSEVTMPQSVAQSLIDREQTLCVCVNGVQITLDAAALRSAAASLRGTVFSVCAEQLASEDLPIAARADLKSADLWNIWLSDRTNRLTELAAGSVTMTLRYRLSGDRNAANMSAYTVNADGSYTWQRAVNDRMTGTLTLTGSRLGVFALTDRLGGILPFADVTAADWYYDDVRYVYESGLMNGVTVTQFAPMSQITRGMLVTILWREENEPAAPANTFTDVARGSYYESAVAWAESRGIVTGVGGGLFKPNDPITREQFVTILYRYAAYKGTRTAAAASLAGFSDASSVSAYALDAVRWAVGTGMMNGRNGRIDPAGFTTRAEAAALLHRCLA